MVKKGKAQRRIKDWGQRFRRDADPDTMDSTKSETLQPGRVKLGASRMRDRSEEPDLAARPQAAGMVVGLFPGGACVRVQGGADLLCAIAGTFSPPKGSSALAVGDEVAVALSPVEQVAGQLHVDKQRTDGFILSRQPRRTALSRPQPTSGKRRGRYDEKVFEKVVAANMEVLLIVASVRQPRLRPGLIDRFLIVGERGELEPLVVLNKIDLGEPDEDTLAMLASVRRPMLRCSVVTGEGLEALRSVLRGRRSVLAGASGTGKSSLVNALVPGADIATATIRQKDQRGRHMTVAATLHELPGGGLVVDTPGVRELALGMEATELPWYFPEFAELSGACKFNNCTHTHEPDCAVIRAVQEGKLPAYRYESYLRILETL